LFRLGHHTSESKFLSLEEMATLFSLDALGRAPARFDEQQLRHWQREAIAHADPALIEPWFERGLGAQKTQQFAKLLKSNVVLPSDAVEWSQLVQNGPEAFGDEATLVIKAAGSGFYDSLEQALATLDPTDTAAWLKSVRVASGLNGPQFFKPLRMAITGRLDGPDLAALLALMDRALLAQLFSKARTLAAGA